MRAEDKAAMRDHIKRLVDAAPEISPERLEHIRVLLRPAPQSGGRAA